MATKAELETELAELKKEFAALSKRETAKPEKPSDKARKPKPSTDANKDKPDSETDSGSQEGSENIETLKVADIEAITTQVLEELEDTFDKKTLAIAFGALVIGYLIGRSR